MIRTPVSNRATLFALLLAAFAPATAALAQRQAELPWWDRAPKEKVGHYWIKTDLPPDQVRGYAVHLNRMYEEYSKRFDHLDLRTTETLNVMLFERRREYEITLSVRFGVNATNTGGMFFVSEAGRALAIWTENLPRRRVEQVIQHEGFHQFAHSRFGTDLPPWVNEGLAEFFGEAVFVGDDLIIGQSKPRIIERVKNAIELKEFVPFQAMVTMSQREWNEHLRAGKAALHYNQAWSMVHFLVYADGGKYREAFDTYLKYINAGHRNEEAFTRAFGGPDLEGFEQRWLEYTTQQQPSAFVTAIERIEFLADGILALRETESVPEDLADLRRMLREMGFKQEISKHGMRVTLSAEDDSLFTIPKDEQAADQPVFVVDSRPPRRMSVRERVLNEKNPLPPRITTEHLAPKEVAVKWIRNEDNTGFTYEIVTGK